jgi:hypothetical protein
LEQIADALGPDESPAWADALRAAAAECRSRFDALQSPEIRQRLLTDLYDRQAQLGRSFFTEAWEASTTTVLEEVTAAALGEGTT